MADLPETPITRKEKYLSAISGQSSTDALPEKPITRTEQYLDYIAKNGTGGGEGGTTNYNVLTNKPSIEGVTLSGDKSLEELGAASAAAVAANSALLVDNAGKNLLEITAETQEFNTILFKVNTDKSITVDGSFDGTSAVIIGEFYAQKGQTYFISGCPAGGSDTTYRIDIRSSYPTIYRSLFEYGDGMTFSAVENIKLYLAVRIAINYKAENLTFYPMVRRAEITDDTFEPYYRSQKRLDTDLSTAETEIEEIKSAIEEIKSAIDALLWTGTQEEYDALTDKAFEAGDCLG